jgi:lipoprotein-anchoring transpeptidase ErfK/SrfK
MRIWTAPLFILAFLLAAPAIAAKLDAKAINEAEFSAKDTKAAGPAIIKAQVLLARARFSPGVIDGHMGENVRQAIAAFRKANGLAEGDRLDQETWSKLTATSSEPVIKEYTISEADVKGPFVKKIPAKMEDMASLERLSYTSPRELIAEKFHMDEDLLRALNPGKSFDKSGTTILVANVTDERPNEKTASIEIDKSEKALRALDKDGKLIAFYPATIGSDEKPAPSGTHQVERVVQNPNYTYNPEYKFKGVKSDKPFTIKPGPNNPVGSVWIDLSVEGYGIHGTPEPSKVGKTFSHGCVRLTNWDAKELAAMVEKGTPVEFKD